MFNGFGIPAWISEMKKKFTKKKNRTDALSNREGYHKYPITPSKPKKYERKYMGLRQARQTKKNIPE